MVRKLGWAEVYPAFMFSLLSLTSEYGKYYTRYVPGKNGCPKCRILRRGHEIRNILTLGSNNIMMLLYSPGFKQGLVPWELQIRNWFYIIKKPWVMFSAQKVLQHWEIPKSVPVKLFMTGLMPWISFFSPIYIYIATHGHHKKNNWLQLLLQISMDNPHFVS